MCGVEQHLAVGLYEQNGVPNMPAVHDSALCHELCQLHGEIKQVIALACGE